MFVNIYIITKNYNSLKRFLIFFNEFCQLDYFHIILFNKKPKIIKKERFTVLKSPHVNKKAGESFEYYFYSHQFHFYSYENKKMLSLIKNIISNIFPDIKIKVIFLSNRLKKKKIKKKLFNPDYFLIKQKINNKYLKMFDIFGESCFNR